MNLSNTVLQGARYLPDHDAIVFEGRRLTYRELNSGVDHVAHYLREQGIRPQDRVALYLENRPEWIMLYYGIIRLGAVVVCVSAAYRKAELEYLLKDSQPACVITSEELAEHIPSGEKLPNVGDIVVIERKDPLLTLCRTAEQTPVAPFPVHDGEGDDPCVILYTGGTTGLPKGAMLTHRNILYTAQNVCCHERTSSRDRGLCFLPLNHVFAGNHIMNSLFYAVGTLILHQGFDMDEIISSIEKNGVTRLYAVPTVYIRLLNTPDCHSRLRSVGYTFSAATSMPAEIVRQWKKTFGLYIHEAYGMTESASLVTFNHLYRHKVGSVGTPAGIVQVRIADGDGRFLPDGAEGEIVIQGPNVMKGYYNHPEETARTLAGGWLHSGDVGRIDEEGYLHVVDRLKDMIISGGLNVYPTEVEDVLYRHRCVEECAVVGLPHEEYGEAVAAFVRLKAETALDKDELTRFCKEHLASYKAPKQIFFVEDFPRTPQGKLLKRELRHS
ncbi:MAG: long-chain-fatty-acid--CoA ligase [Desulfohalobiaceae bacterium]|nr:long-chain-fatty-acid--CoA ligase [Desulfohalobiaceae bacterium]